MAVSQTTLLVIFILFSGTLVRSALGFGEALIAVPLLALLLPVEVAAPTAVLVSITIAFIIFAQEWRSVHYRSAGWLLLSTLFGIPAGLYLLKAFPEPVVKAILGIVIAGFALHSLRVSKRGEWKDDRFAWVFGWVAGLLGGSVWDERSSAGDLRLLPGLDSGAVSGDAASLFSSGQLGGDGWLLGGRPVDSGGEPLLSDFPTGGAGGDLSGALSAPEAARAEIFPVGASWVVGDWLRAGAAGDSEIVGRESV